MLTPGMMVRLRSRTKAFMVWARTRPESLTSRTFGSDQEELAERKARLVMGNIDDETICLYVSTYVDTFKSLIDGRKIEYYMVIWGGKPVWVSSTECLLERA